MTDDIEVLLSEVLTELNLLGCIAPVRGQRVLYALRSLKAERDRAVEDNRRYDIHLYACNVQRDALEGALRELVICECWANDRNAPEHHRECPVMFVRRVLSPKSEVQRD